jgi:hypothetical protein
MKKGAPTLRSKRENRPQGPAASAKQAPPEMRIRPENGLDKFEFLTPCEAITWAAFGQAVKADDLTRLLPPELARWSSEPRHWLPKLFHQPRKQVVWGEFSPGEILDTLMIFDNPADTLSEEQLRPIIFYLKNREKLGLSPFRIIRGRTASEHIEFLMQYLAKAADVELKLIESRHEFLKLISLGHIVLSGLPVDSYKFEKRPREQISREAFLPGVTISFDGYLADASGWTLSEGLFVELDGVRRAYPFGPIEPLAQFFLQEAPSSVAPVGQGPQKRHAGGKPRSSASILVQRELVRLDRLNQLPADIAAAKQQMTHFLMDNGHEDSLPSEQSLENWIKPFYS